MVSLGDRREKIKDDHNGSSDCLYICPQSDDIFETVNSALMQTSDSSHAKTTHTAEEETPTLKEILQAWALDEEWQVTTETVELPALLHTYESRSVLVPQDPGNRALREYISVTS